LALALGVFDDAVWRVLAKMAFSCSGTAPGVLALTLNLHPRPQT
jgi:hypothetical protein